VKTATVMFLSIALVALAAPVLPAVATGAIPPTSAEPEKGVAAPQKTAVDASGLPPASRIKGDTVEECWVIPSLPFTEAGNNCGFVDDYEEMCPYGSNSPDVVYSYSPPYDMCVSVSLCDSYYDTKVFVYEDKVMGGWPYACNDDNFHCVDPPVDYTSWIEDLEIFAGHTYYIIVDGYAGYCGDYVLAVEEVDCSEPCDLVCDGIPEGEPTCYTDYVDEYNAGCQNETWLEIPVSPDPIVYCGESGVYYYGSLVYRDTDWYLIYPCGDAPITATVESEIPMSLIYVDLRGGCSGVTVWSYVYVPPCVPTSMTEYLPVGQFAVFVAPEDWSLDYPCGAEYVLTIEGYTDNCNPVPVESQSWGRLKSLYR
jgi:hypothetical protein